MIWRNKKNILALADLIESLSEDKFDMTEVTRRMKKIGVDNESGFDDDYETSCGTPSCIAGWAAWEQQERPATLTVSSVIWNTENGLIADALRYFEIEDQSEAQRVMDKLFRGGYDYFENNTLTKEDAVRALREYAQSGKIIWPDYDNEVENEDDD